MGAMTRDEWQAKVDGIFTSMRAEHGSWKAVADALGVGKKTLDNWRFPQAPPSEIVLSRICAKAASEEWVPPPKNEEPNADMLALLKAGRTAHDLAKICSVGYQAASYWVKGRTVPRPAACAALAQARAVLEGKPLAKAAQADAVGLPLEFDTRLQALTVKKARRVVLELERMEVNGLDSWLRGKPKATVRNWQVLRALERRILGKPQGPWSESLPYALEGLRRLIAWGIPASTIVTQIGSNTTSVRHWLTPHSPWVPGDMAKVARIIEVYEAHEQNRLRDWARESAEEARENEAAA